MNELWKIGGILTDFDKNEGGILRRGGILRDSEKILGLKGGGI